jgi:hypothetical protein
MPPSGEILSWATAVANEWRHLAIWWHAALAGLLAAVVLGWRPSNRLLGCLLLSPLLSVSAVAWASGNPFNGLAFAVLAAALAAVAVGLPIARVRIASWSRLAPGAGLVLFGWVYPHFVESQSWIAFGVAAPLGLIPCPTLSAIIGLTMTFDLLGSRPWSRILAAFGVAYGLIGLLVLGVWIDVFLLAGGVVLGIAGVSRGRHHWVGHDSLEREGRYHHPAAWGDAE